MKTVLKVLLLLLVSSVPVFWETINNNNIKESNEELESQITPESSDVKIKKLQILFKELKLYSWDIDWNYSSIEKSLIDYQIKSWLVEKRDSWWAWYFWKKTINQLKIDFKEEFKKSASKHLKVSEPKLWVRYFVVTAYYSPLPWQKRYTTWTFAWDKRLNWNWKVTASGKWVFPWLLAAPRNYKFWTKIYLDWIWIGSVEDRWWAIVNAWERWFSSDRIDIWMWYWDEWLIRALKWWKRTIKWELVLTSEVPNIEFEKSPVYKYWNLKITPESKASQINKLQELFKELELYSWDIDWNYESIKPDLVQFQLDNKIINSSNDNEAWYFWPKTIAAIRQKYVKNIFIEKYKQTNKINDYWLPLKTRLKLEKIWDKIDKYFDNKFSWNVDKINKYKIKLKVKLDKLIDKQNNLQKRNELKFLNNII